jgi:hypothetical protein
MANSSVQFQSRGTRVFHGKAGAAIRACRFVTRTPASDSTHLGMLVECGVGSNPVGASPAAFADGDDADYHKQGIVTVTGDGASTLSAATIGGYVKAGAAGIAVLDHATTRTLLAAGVQIGYNAAADLVEIELF